MSFIKGAMLELVKGHIRFCEILYLFLIDNICSGYTVMRFFIITQKYDLIEVTENNFWIVKRYFFNL